MTGLRTTLVLFAWIALVQLGVAQQPRSDAPKGGASSEAHDAIEAIRKKHGLVGLMGGHFDSRDHVELHAAGLKKSGSRLPLEPTDRMHLGSCTKSMTATLIGMLVDQGKLTFASTLGSLFPDHTALAESEWRHVTIEELLAHRSGAPANAPWWPLHQKHKTNDQEYRAVHEQVLNWLITQKRPKPDKHGRREFLYSNVGYVLLGYVIEQLTDRSWESVIRSSIFEPLNMESAGFGPPSRVHQDDSVWGHTTTLGFHAPTEMDNPPSLGPAGTVHASLTDWAKYLRTHMEHRHPDRQPSGFVPSIQLLRPETLRSLHSPREHENYTGGWVREAREWAGGDVLFHNGSNTYWYCVVFLSLEQDRAFFAASNVGLSASTGCDEVLQWFIRHNPSKPPRE